MTAIVTHAKVITSPSSGADPSKVYGQDWLDNHVIVGLAAVAESGLSSDLTNDAGFITSGGAPVQSVNGQTGAVSITTISGNAGTATTLATGRTISLTGDVTYTSPTFNGSANVSAAATIAANAVTFAKASPAFLSFAAAHG